MAAMPKGLEKSTWSYDSFLNGRNGVRGIELVRCYGSLEHSFIREIILYLKFTFLGIIA